MCPHCTFCSHESEGANKQAQLSEVSRETLKVPKAGVIRTHSVLLCALSCHLHHLLSLCQPFHSRKKTLAHFGKHFSEDSLLLLMDCHLGIIFLVFFLIEMLLP